MVVINETFARRFWPGESAIGKRIQIRRHNPDEFRPQGPEFCEVIGIVKDVKYDMPWEEKMPFIYYPTLALIVTIRSNYHRNGIAN